MQHLLKNGKNTYVHTIYWQLFSTEKPIETMINLIKDGGWLIKIENANLSVGDIDLMFNENIIWHNNYNEEFLNSIKQMEC